MQQETQTSKPSAGAIVAIVGGVMLAIGSFLTWATVSVDTTALLNKLADTLGVSADQLQGVPTDSFSQSVSGWDGSDGKITLVVALIIIIAAILMFAMPRIRKAMGVVVILAGLVGGGVAVYDATRVKDVANDAESAAASAAGSGLEQLGLSAGEIFDGVFDVTAGVGLWVCIAGGVVALVGGVLALRERQEASPAAMGATTATTSRPRLRPRRAPGSMHRRHRPRPQRPRPRSRHRAAAVTEPPPAPVAPPAPAAPEAPPATPAPAPPPASTEGDAPGDSGAPPS